MIHLGDITKISGYTAPVVDCIIGGSPCQDLSVAGKRAGLEGQRSGLFMEQIRIIKEMRENDRRNGRAAECVRPRYMVWENVPGAFSSNKGEDFRLVLEEVARIIDEGVSIPRPPKGKWRTTGVIIGDGYSIAQRVFDAQFWGVPQRRRRICIVADFNGYTAPQIVFSEDQYYRSTKRSDREPSVGYIGDESRSEVQSFCKSLSGDSEQSGTERERASCDTKRGIALYDCEGKGFYWDGGQACPTLTANNAAGQQRMSDKDNLNCVIQPVVSYSIENHPNDSRVGINEDGKVQALTSRMGTGGGNVPMVMQCYSKSKRAQTATDNETWVESETANTLNAFDVGDVRITEVVVYALDTTHPTCTVRRLTPLECERLQGYPDGWTDIGEYTNSNGKKCKASDASRYKALGNSIALPSWKWVLKRICGCYERDATMASLFDGLGGFPYLWQQINGKGSCLWASEIEEFPIAVTKERIG